VAAALAAPLVLTVILIPVRGQFPNTAPGFGIATGRGLPQDTDTKLLVEGSGVFQGRFLMSAAPAARLTPERLVAIAFAKQVGAALASSHPLAVMADRVTPASEPAPLNAG
jgi:hypothetical protein